MKKLFRHFFSTYNTQPEEFGNTSANKYVKSGLSLQEASEIKEKIKQAFERDKLYKSNAIGLNDLSLHIAKDRYKVSQVLNEYLAKNFYSLLNHYRIQEAKDLLVSQPFLSVKAVMYEVGFNSKTSFYSAFKKETGLCPNDFRVLTSYAS
ncbi:AraC family transcriptional regulator [Flagellimonas hymeniacidonis]|uniref:AraC family transcriptional regulator n=1 Tax=Flagellimonas hymeniacidonis TaxID=2603628 RepID=A0A5C8V2K9_9FLAO|nr:helix-turn-helix domain-containing protein [Flagellimonas hymeniacidonis]TXN34717.1 AraC family transcriptional regulator [Flagellimonas hymeniacidonis]